MMLPCTSFQQLRLAHQAAGVDMRLCSGRAAPPPASQSARPSPHAAPLPLGRQLVAPLHRCYAATAGGGAQLEAAAAPPEASTSGRADAPPGRTRRGKARTCDFTTLAACVAELQQSWVPAKVDQVVQPDAATVCLKLRNQAMLDGAFAEKQWLYLSWHQTLARACVGPAPERGGSSEAFSLAEQLHAALRGKVLLAVRLPVPWERNAELEFGARIGEPSHRLFLEIMGNYSNLALTDAGGRILACARQVSSRQSSRRSLQTGAGYAHPPAQAGAQPSEEQPQEAWQVAVAAAASERSGGGVAAALSTAYQGMSPGTAAELCEAAGVSPDAPPSALSAAQWGALHAHWQAWLATVSGGSFSPVTAPDGSFSMLGCLPGGRAVSALDAVDEYYRMPQEEDGFGRSRQQVAGAVRRALSKLQSKQRALRQQLQQSELAEQTQKRADLIMAHLHLYTKGATQLQVQDWDTGESMSLELDAAVPAKDQAKALYKKARKLRRTSDNVEPLLRQADEDQAFLEEIEAQVEQLSAGDRGDAEALQQIQDELVQRKFAKPPPEAALAAKGASKAKRAAKRQKQAGPNFRRFTSPSGFQVLVGRSNLQNDELTHRVANAWDLWFHARGVPGSHAVLRLPSGREAAQADIEFAADAAAYWSKARANGKADVVYAPVKDLSKPKGARPGQVLVSSERVIVAVPDRCPAAAQATTEAAD